VACRTRIFRKLKTLDAVISIVDPLMAEQGWTFSDGEGCVPDTVNGFPYLHKVYTAARRDHTGRVTVPVLFDKETGTIVNNESSEIIRMLNSEFDEFGDDSRDLYQVAGVAETVNLDHIKRHYFMSHTSINPTRIVPKGPAIDFSLLHDRSRFP
jgi:putative glutathione S-transferase